MERRENGDRRQSHVFVSEDRREGPYDRRDADLRHQEVAEQKAKIERIRAFKAKDRAAAAQPLFTTQRLVFIGIGLVILVLALVLIN